MKLKDLIAQLSQYPEDTEVAIFDWRRADHDAGGEATNIGLYTDFELNLFTNEDVDDAEPVLALMFDNLYVDVENEGIGNVPVESIIEVIGHQVLIDTMDGEKLAECLDAGFCANIFTPGDLIKKMYPADVKEFLASEEGLEFIPEKREYLKYDPFADLQKLQLEYGYKKGELNPVALLGLFGEAGEVLNEVVLLNQGKIIDKEYSLAVLAAEIIDGLKKFIRDSPIAAPDVFIAAEDDGKKFDLELADVVYYATLCALGRGRSLQYYAELSYNKVKAKGLKAPETDGKE